MELRIFLIKNTFSTSSYARKTVNFSKLKGYGDFSLFDVILAQQRLLHLNSDIALQKSLG